MIFNTFV